MRLQFLRIAGFKSFVSETIVPIEGGITVIVGPNGCGKSNIVEALRWVMGEASAKRMRADEMDDVIFSGSPGRTRRDFAEVGSPILEQLSGGSAIALNPQPHTQQHEDYAPVRLHLHNKPHTAYIHRAHIARPKKLQLTADSLIREARRYLGLPYIWGGRSFRGLDCSGLIQQVLAAHGIAAPRDSDMQAGEVEGISPIGAPTENPIERGAEPQSGDICFWHGHVGIFTGSHLIHAYGGSCLVSEDAAKNIFPRLKSATNNDMRIVRCLI